jgi:hypothetical protein
MIRTLLVIILGLVTAAPAIADAIANPCKRLRQNRVTAGAASSSVNTQIAITGNVPSALRPQTITVKNEATAAGDVAYFNLESGTAVATDATNGANIRIEPGEAISVDLVPYAASGVISFIRGGANNVPLKIIAGY